MRLEEHCEGIDVKHPGIHRGSVAGPRPTRTRGAKSSIWAAVPIEPPTPRNRCWRYSTRGGWPTFAVLRLLRNSCRPLKADSVVPLSLSRARLSDSAATRLEQSCPTVTLFRFVTASFCERWDLCSLRRDFQFGLTPLIPAKKSCDFRPRRPRLYKERKGRPATGGNYFGWDKSRRSNPHWSNTSLKNGSSNLAVSSPVRYRPSRLTISVKHGPQTRS
jgi:hypothetical protein